MSAINSNNPLNYPKENGKRIYCETIIKTFDKQAFNI